MKASQCSLQTVFNAAAKDEDLALILSFAQVEYGLTELQGLWDGFVDSSDHYETTFKSRKDVANQFAGSLVDYYDLFEYAEQLAQ
jgi:hypothetical protein